MNLGTKLVVMRRLSKRPSSRFMYFRVAGIGGKGRPPEKKHQQRRRERKGKAGASNTLTGKKRNFDNKRKVRQESFTNYECTSPTLLIGATMITSHRKSSVKG